MREGVFCFWIKIMNRKKIVFIFGGQGSQYNGMAKELYNENEVFRNSMNFLDEIFIEKMKKSIIQHIYNVHTNDKEMLDLSISHPAIFMVEYSLYKMLLSIGIIPDILVGFSLGEYIALSTLNEEMLNNVINCIIKQIEIINNKCCKGKMIVIYQDVSLYYKNYDLFIKSELVMNNPSSYFVVSTEHQDEIQCLLKKKKILFQFMPVNYGFHSSLIENAKKEYVEYIEQYDNIMPDILLISGLGKRVVNENSIYLWDILRKPMQFNETMYLLKDIEDKICIDLSPNAMIKNTISSNNNYVNKFSNQFILSKTEKASKKIEEIQREIGGIKL